MNKSKYFTHVGAVLDSMFILDINDSNAQLLKISKLWNELVGNEIAKNTYPLAVKNSVLLVYVSNSVLLHHLLFLKQKILIRLEHILDKEIVKDIEFKVSHL